MLDEFSKISHPNQQTIWHPGGFNALAFDLPVCSRYLFERGFIAGNFDLLPDELVGIGEEAANAPIFSMETTWMVWPCLRTFSNPRHTADPDLPESQST